MFAEDRPITMYIHTHIAYHSLPSIVMYPCNKYIYVYDLISFYLDKTYFSFNVN